MTGWDASDSTRLLRTLDAIATHLEELAESTSDLASDVHAVAMTRQSEVVAAQAGEEPCGSWRVVEYHEGDEHYAVWCPRRPGHACAYPGTEQSAGRPSNRPCAAPIEQPPAPVSHLRPVEDPR